MPHLTLTTSTNLGQMNFASFFKHSHQVLQDTVGAKPASCKSRHLISKESYVGSGQDHSAFIHLDIIIKKGYTPQQINQAGQILLEALKQHAQQCKPASDVKVSLEIREVSDYYFK